MKIAVVIERTGDLANFRFDLYSVRIGAWVPYVTAGGGIYVFRELGMDDEAFAYQGGVGWSWWLGRSLGLRFDGRVIRLGSVLGTGETTNGQATAGLVWRF